VPPEVTPEFRAPTRWQRAHTLTGRSEGCDSGARGIQALQQANYTTNRIAFDPFDARAKEREAADLRADGLDRIAIPEDRPILTAAGEAILPDLATGGLTPEQRRTEIDIVDTLENPTMINLGASQLRMEALQTLGILQPAMDAAQSIQADNSIEKMLVHQMIALHFAGMDMMKRSAGAGYFSEPEPAVRTRYLNAGVRAFDGYREHMMAFVKFKARGQQTVVVQHVNVSDGGQAIVAGAVTKGGGSQGGGTGSK
jgi:hypothetical protein